MAHFAEIDENNVVLRVLVVPNEEETRGQDFLANDLGLGGRWIQTSYNKNFRKNYAGIGYLYNEKLDIFLPPKPYPSWSLNENTGEWNAPVEIPKDTNFSYSWNENTLNWEAMDLPTI